MLKLKALHLNSFAVQAPMAGCTDLAFRLIGRQHGMELAFLEMISAEALVRASKQTMELLERVPEDRPLGAQLVGGRALVIAEAAAKIESLGFDVLDINLGCPVPKVTSKGGGSRLLTDPKKAGDIFRAAAQAVRKIPVTVKLRSGYENPSGQEAILISKIAEDCGISAVTVHGRTRAQKYMGKADWSVIEKVKKSIRIPVIGNGDIFTGADARRMIDQTGCDLVMVGRGALGSPWIYGEIDAVLKNMPIPKPPALEEMRKVLLKHFDLEIRLSGERKTLFQMRPVACWYFKKIPGVSDFRFQINRCKSIAEMRRLIEEFGPKKN